MSSSIQPLERIDLQDAKIINPVKLDCLQLKHSMMRNYVTGFHDRLRNFYFEDRYLVSNGEYMIPRNITLADLHDQTRLLSSHITMYCGMEPNESKMQTNTPNHYMAYFQGMQSMEAAIYMVLVCEYQNLSQLYTIVSVKNLSSIIDLPDEFVESFEYTQYRLLDILSQPKIWSIPYTRGSIVWGTPTERFTKSTFSVGACGITEMLLRRRLTPTMYCVKRVFSGIYKPPSVKSICEMVNMDVSTMCVSGTACCGKSSSLYYAFDQCKAKNQDFTIVSRGDIGGFSGKDYNIARANLCGLSIARSLQRVKCVGDRTEYDNTLWRCIMEIMSINDEDERIERALEWFSINMNEAILEGMRNNIVVIFINSNIETVLYMMHRRGEGGDLKRLAIPNYVSAQNIVYTIYALMCGFPILNVNFIGIDGCRDYLNEVVYEFMVKNTKPVQTITRESLAHAPAEDMQFANVVDILK